MTYEDLCKIPLKWSAHLAMDGEHCSTYLSADGRVGVCDHQPYDSVTMRPKGRGYRHYMIDGRVFRSKKKLLEALPDIDLTQPPTNKPKEV